MIDEDPRLFTAEIILNLMLSYRDIQVCSLCTALCVSSVHILYVLLYVSVYCAEYLLSGICKVCGFHVDYTVYFVGFLQIRSQFSFHQEACSIERIQMNLEDRILLTKYKS